MLEISRWKVLAILLTMLVVCLAAVPNLLPKSTFDRLPKWAQHKIGIEASVHGGSRVLFAVDTAAVRKEKLESVRDELRRVLRTARIALASAPVVRGNSVEVRVRDVSDVAVVMTKLREAFMLDEAGKRRAARPDSSVAPAPIEGPSLTASRGWPVLPPPVREVVIGSDDRLIRLTVTEAAVRQSAYQSRDAAVFILQHRLADIGMTGSVEPRGRERIAFDVPGLHDPSRIFAIQY